MIGIELQRWLQFLPCHSSSIITGTQLDLAKCLSSFIMEVYSCRFYPCIVSVSGIIHISSIHLKNFTLQSQHVQSLHSIITLGLIQHKVKLRKFFKNSKMAKMVLVQSLGVRSPAQIVQYLCCKCLDLLHILETYFHISLPSFLLPPSALKLGQVILAILYWQNLQISWWEFLAC